MAVKSLLSILADGELHSGQEIADILDISRTAVWKQLQGLEACGLQVERIRGRGYRLDRPLDLLDEGRLASVLPRERRAQLSLDLQPIVASTNDRIMAAPFGCRRFSACLAEQQTAGRGRRGRSWISPFGQNLYLSLGFRLRRGWAGIEGLSLVAGLAVVDALANLGVEKGVALKWPNDIWLNDRKLAGILIELKGEAQSECNVVLGLGLNVYMEARNVTGIDQPWTSLAREGVVPEGGKNRLAATLLDNLMDKAEQFDREGFGVFRARWAHYDALADRPVTILDTGERGFGRGVDERGAYLVEMPEGLRACTSGEVSVRAHG
ncbi:bifunctional biotin--[acetyl-CoA-carboxylase] ligase/biotin operon repressor BirA [Marinobacteraceae bacterium S3BR75-40.1]